MERIDDFMPRPAMVEIAVADVRRAGESGLALLERLACVDRLIADDPGARVVLLVRSSCLPSTARQMCSAGVAPVDDGTSLLELAAAGRGRQPSLERVLWEHAQRMLVNHRGNRKAAARALRISEGSLRRRLESRPPV